MPRVRSLCCALLIASCAARSDRGDHQAAGSSDPWASAAGQGGKPAGTGGDKPSDDGFDLKSSLQKIADNLTKPGPYEAPEASTDFDEAKPHWGVLALHGSSSLRA